MKILISQLEFIRPPRNFVFDALERAYYTLFESHTLIPAPNTVKVLDNDYDCLVLTGGPDSIARNKTENLLFYDAFNKGVPIIGICHGAFAINDICGGTHGEVSGHLDKDVVVTMEETDHTVRCYHTQSIKKLPAEFVAIANDQKGNIEAFKHVSRPIYGILWHPERMKNPVLPKEVKKLLD